MLSFFNREFLVWQTVMPLAYVFIHGFGYAAMLVVGQETDIIPLGNGHSISYLAFITTGALSEVLIQGALLAGLTIQRDKHNGMLKQMMMMPCYSPRTYVFSVAITGVLMSSLGVFMLLVAGSPLLRHTTHYTPHLAWPT